MGEFRNRQEAENNKQNFLGEKKAENSFRTRIVAITSKTFA